MISATRYKDQSAVTLETERLRAQFLPGIGAKLCSLIAKPQGQQREIELLVQRPSPAYRLQPYGGIYVDGECSGLDDMFPTIDVCHYEGHPWQGTVLPDHGEVWSLPWAYEIDSAHDQLQLSVHGVRLPYRLEKTISFSDDCTLRMDYTLHNLSPFDMDFLWAAHPMFVMDEGSQVILPNGADRVALVFQANGNLGRYGDELVWPVATLSDGQQRDLSVMAPKSSARAAKFYVKGRLPEGWCQLTYPARGLALTLRFPVEQVPYLGILSNEGGWDDLYNIFLEPTTSSFDRPDVARLRGECAQVKAGQQYRWYLSISVDALKNP